MLYDTKTAIIVRNDLLTWQRLNITAFVCGGIAAAHPGIIGENYQDASGLIYPALIREPVFVFEAKPAELPRTLERALRRGIKPAIYTEDMFVTSNDHDNRQAVAAVPTDALNLVGLAIHGERKQIGKITSGLKRHP